MFKILEVLFTTNLSPGLVNKAFRKEINLQFHGRIQRGGGGGGDRASGPSPP